MNKAEHAKWVKALQETREHWKGCKRKGSPTDYKEIVNEKEELLGWAGDCPLCLAAKERCGKCLAVKVFPNLPVSRKFSFRCVSLYKKAKEIVLDNERQGYVDSIFCEMEKYLEANKP